MMLFALLSTTSKSFLTSRPVSISKFTMVGSSSVFPSVSSPSSLTSLTPVFAAVKVTELEYPPDLFISSRVISRL